MNKKPTFFTSDWHIGHSNVLKLDKRPFKDLNEMAYKLIKNYNNTVPKDGVCYFLGDMGFNSKAALKSVITRLNGLKVLVLGNHDGSDTSMYKAGFDLVINAGVIYIANQRVSFSHCPLMGIPREKIDGHKNWHGEEKNHKFSLTAESEIQFHLHGHIHSRKDRNASETRTDRQFDVGVPANNYRPVNYTQIESWIQRTLNKEGKLND